MKQILHKRGLESSIPKAMPSEILYTTDSKKLFYGTSDGNVELAKKIDVENTGMVLLNHLNSKDNPHAVTKAQVGLGSVQNYGIATTAEAEAGTATGKYMTPALTKASVVKFAPQTEASGTTKGLMSSTDKSKLDGIAVNANNYVLPTATSSALGGVKQGTNITIAADGTISSANTTYSLATTSANGLMAATDKVKLNGIATNANNYIHPDSHPASMITGLATVATSGSYNDLSNKPSIPTVGTAGSKNTGTTSGTVPLIGSDGKLDASIMPAITISDTFVVGTQAAMLALNVQVGDIAVRTDLSKSFILKATPATTLANWQELLTPASPVQSVAGKTGTITLAKTDVGLSNVDNVQQAAKTEFDAHTANTTVHITAAERTAWNGKASTAAVTITTNGLMLAADKTKIDSIESGANNYVLPVATGTSIGGVKAGTNVTISADGTISSTNTTYSTMSSAEGIAGTSGNGRLVTAARLKEAIIEHAPKNSEVTTDTSGLMIAADKMKLDGIAEGANKYVLPIATNAVVGGVKAGTNITIAADGAISSANTTYAVATTSTNGLMASTDKVKLDGIASGANNYSLPTATNSVLGGIKTGDNITNTSGVISVSNATTSVKGVVQLSDTLTSTSTTLAATANSVKVLEDKKINKAGDTMSGDLNMGANALKLGGMALRFNSVSGSIDLEVL